MSVGERPRRRDSEPAPDARGIATGPAIVGIGASAGGLDALQRFFAHLPAVADAAFVLVLHHPVDPRGDLCGVVGRFTSRPVSMAADGVRPEAGHVYLRIPGEDLLLRRGVFRRGPDVGRQIPPRAIDIFFRSLAEDQGERAIAVVLSGTGSDGVAGLRAVKGAGGVVMAQDAGTALFDGMPESACATGLVDVVDTIERLPQRLVDYLGGSYLAAEPGALADDEGDDVVTAMREILAVLRTRVGHDFTHYKTNTIRRRIERHMAVHRLRSPREYVRLLHRRPGELDTLFHQLLIGVTAFFRDPDAFAALERQALPPLLAGKPDDQALRVWVAGCSTGEEAYSVAILLQEALERTGRRFPVVQVFATDLDPVAIQIARAGVYPASIDVDVGPERLHRYFTRVDDAYRIKREIRETVIFAPHNVTRDPPFLKLDLITCRNLLIYFDNSLQNRVMPLFHHALRPGGVLFLGSSESVGDSRDLFEVVDKRWKVFRRRDGSTIHVPPELPAAPVRTSVEPARPRGNGDMDEDRETEARRFERALIQSWLPPSVVVRGNGELVYVHGRTGEFLEPAPGHASHNVLAMAREGLREPLEAALDQASAQDDPVFRRDVRVRGNGQFAHVHLTVRRMTGPPPLAGLLLVTFEPAREGEAAARDAAGPADDRVEALERELQFTRENLHNTVEELETANEELKAAVEEYQSTNEELQSTNEELETSKEELQSLNEELHTVNSELENKLEALSRANDDMANLLNSSDVATLFLDDELRVQRFTTQVKRVVKLIASDAGRFIGDFASELRSVDLAEVASEVRGTLGFREREVAARDGSWYLMRAMPYRTAANVVDGVVITFVDITRFKVGEDLSDMVRQIVGAVPAPMMVVDGALRVVAVNAALSAAFPNDGATPDDARPFGLDERRWDVARLRELVEGARDGDGRAADVEVEPFPGRRAKLRAVSRRLRIRSGPPELFALVFEHTEGGA